MSEETLTIKVNVEQPSLTLLGGGGSQQSLSALITFGKWFKGDKGDKGDPGAVKHGTTEYWNSQIGFIPEAGEIIVYDDYYTDPDTGDIYPNIKIGSGNGYVQDLVFLGQQETQILLNHISDTAIHIIEEEREKWNNKLNFDDQQEVEDETLIFNRN